MSDNPEPIQTVLARMLTRITRQAECVEAQRLRFAWYATAEHLNGPDIYKLEERDTPEYQAALAAYRAHVATCETCKGGAQ